MRKRQRYYWNHLEEERAYRRKYMRRRRFERRLWATLDLKLDEEHQWNESNGSATEFWP